MKTKQVNPKARLIGAAIAFVAMLPVVGYVNTHTLVKATVTDVTGNTAYFETLSGNIYSAYVNNTSLQRNDKVKLIMKNNDQNTFEDDEIVMIF